MPFAKKNVASFIGEDFNGNPTWKDGPWPGNIDVGEDSNGDPTWKGGPWPGNADVGEDLNGNPTWKGGPWPDNGCGCGGVGEDSEGNPTWNGDPWPSNAHDCSVGEDSEGNPTWKGDPWPNSITDHNNLSNLNANNDYLHITKAEKEKYENYEDLINNLLARVYELEYGTPITPIVLSIPTIHNTANVELFNEIYVDFPIIEGPSGATYAVNAFNIVASDNSIITNAPSIVDIAGDLFLRVPVTLTNYNETYSVTAKKNAIVFEGIGNEDPVTATFVTKAAEELIIVNSSLHGEIDVPVTTSVVSYSLINNSPNSVITINADNITVAGASLQNVALVNNDTINVYLTGVAHDQTITVTLGAGVAFNSGTANTSVVITTFTIESPATPLVEPEFDLPSIDGSVDVPVYTPINVDIPIIVSDDVTYIINSSNIITQPINIIDGTVEIVDIGEDKYLRIPIQLTEYNEQYTITIDAGTLEYGDISNTQSIVITFTTVAAEEPIINNSGLHTSLDVDITNLTLEYNITRTDTNTVLSLDSVSAVTANNATISNVQLIGDVLHVSLTDLNYDTLVEVTIGAGVIDNSGTKNTLSVVTTFNTMSDPNSSGNEPEIVWEYTYILGGMDYAFDLDSNVDNSFNETLTLEEFYGPAYDGVNKLVELLWFGYDSPTGLLSEGLPMATSVDAWEHSSPDGKVDFNGINTITFTNGSLSDRVYKLVKYSTPITRV